MGKKLVITDKIKQAIIKSTGDAEFDTSKVSVFETACYNTLPLNKRGLFQNATTTEATLHEMAAYVNNGGFVPIHTLHSQEFQLPVGRIFSAEVAPAQNGLPELHALFYIGNENTELVDGVDTSSIDEVSVGMKPVHLNCSVCGFDYLGADSTADNIYGQVCNEGHQIGVDGTHLIISGMDRWLETSLVSLGAAKNAKILSRTKSLMGAESYEKLAASGVSPEATVLFTQSPLTPKQESNKMEIKELVTMNASLTAEKAVAEHKVTELTAAVAKLTADKTALETELTTVKQSIPADAAKTVADLKAANDALVEQTAYLRKEADRLCVAAGVNKLADTATFAELSASIDANRVKLSAAFGGSGASNSQGTGSGEDSAAPKTAASYKTTR